MSAPKYPLIDDLPAEIFYAVLECPEHLRDRIEDELRTGELTPNELERMVSDTNYWQRYKVAAVAGAIHTGVAEAAMDEAKKGPRAANIEMGKATRARFVQCVLCYELEQPGAFCGDKQRTLGELANSLLAIHAKKYPDIKLPAYRHLKNLISDERRGLGPDNALAKLRSRTRSHHST